jgi:hypothetical protein
MKISYPFRWLLPSAFALSVLLLGWYCKRESVPTIPTDPNSGGTLNRSECAAYVSYQSETTTYGKVINDADAALLQPEDHLLMLPHRQRYSVEACYKSDGNSTVVINYLAPNAPIQYPDGTVDAYYQPDYTKIIINNGWATYYDQSGNELRSGDTDFEQQSVLKIVEAAARQVPTQAARNKIFELMQTNNVIADTNPNDNMVSVRVDEPDGSHTVQVIDKSTLCFVGNFSYDAAGVLTNRTLLDIEGTAEEPIIKSMLIESRFQAVSSAAIPVRLMQFSQFDNFTIITN